MSIHIALRHITRYRYDRPIHLGPQVVRLRPAPHARTRILSYSLKVLPATHFINWQQDPQSNHLARLVFPDKTTEFEIAVDLVAEMAVYNPFDFFLEKEAEYFPFQYDATLDHELAPYLKPCRLGPAFEQFMSTLVRDRCRTVDYLVYLNQLLFKRIDYLIRLEPGVQTPDETLLKRSGSCRDSAWLMVQVLRRLGLAARFASGYLIQLKSDVKAIDGPDGPEADFTDLHAWCEVYLPGAGWIGLDPTSGLLAGEGHIPLACSPDPSSAAPITGALDECEVVFEHTMTVQRIHEAPRTSKPYTDDTWAAIEAMGHQVDQVLDKLDVRLTMGGEPTFVSSTDRGGAEWNTEALGPTKRAHGAELLKRMARHYGTGGFFHFGQGKWYPGEQLPRWALSLYWMKDGTPLWHNRELLDDEQSPGRAETTTAQVFLKRLCHNLFLSDAHVLAGYEDVWYHLWRERRLPVNVDPFDSRLDDALERKRLRAVFAQGLGTVTGYCLPLAKSNTCWKTGPWFLRDERLYLLPGDSPMGYRLPLDSLPWASKADLPVHIERDPFDTTPPPLTQRTAFQTKAAAQSVENSGSHDEPALFDSASGIVRTALCAQVRNGHLYIFMPPLAGLEAYAELLSAIEQTAADLDCPVVLEGYPPPRDPRLTVLQMTPDPGVLEVNVHPSKHWGELLALTTTLYEEARQCGLSTEKFMLDGRHTGTGGGNHIVMGGDTPADSPFLRRPDLLASLLRYWHNHPGLSYLFSGLFIGPTSQAPRVDEARSDQTHELELALTELDRQTQRYRGEPPPWLVDRLLRNLLVDATGNTHRSEFCIDKLYSPDSTTGRLGLLELRAFEMPPNARMSLAQQLLLRSLIAHFWQRPYKARLVNWGNRLHDQFMLPTFVRQDLSDVLEDLNQAGFDLKMAWFEPHFAFRFPKIGDLQVRDLQLDIHAALEPWHVLGEEGSAGGTVRYVDSSLERLEVRLRNWVDERYQLCCNGHRVPLHPTGREGEYVAGVRYRAWQPPNALHPTIGVHAPLVFDVVDTWNGRSLGGCQVHVAHPGGRNYEVFPVNAFEAESRRLARFFRMGQSQGALVASDCKPRGEFPLTLDLRWT
ncbi:MAG TPA: transglutaminase family protein [Limnobacter sp.]|uniref:transglutaminase family protein n=1 Tax=Limnobacter sp. TaxID=2003368 RepID=UPI002EDA80B0